MQIIRDTSGFVANWASTIIGSPLPEGAMSFGVLNDNNQLVGAVTLHDIKKHLLSLSVAGTNPRWASRKNLKSMFEVMFNEMDKNLITVLVSANNVASLRLTRGVGFREEGRLREAGPDGEDMIIFGMLKRECEFLDPPRDDLPPPAP